MKAPSIRHLRQPAIINTDPAIEDTGHYFEQENDNELRLAQARVFEEPDTRDKPGKENEINDEQEVLQAALKFKV